MKKFTKLACDYIELDPTIFDNSMAKIMNGGEATAESAKEFSQMSAGLRKQLDTERHPVTLPKATFIKAIQRKLQLEVTLKSKLQEMQGQTAFRDLVRI